jgi:ubiquinone/menaquinone biosynthesis C-methylase UbiE
MNCDRIAPFYAAIEFAAFGRALEGRRRAMLGELAAARRALVLGDGDGRFLQDLLAANPSVRVDYIDLSHGMLTRARRRAGSDRVTYVNGDARSVEFAASVYDLIATHFFLDCFSAEELGELVPRVRRAAAPGARWVISEFRVPDNRWLAAPARAFIRLMYAFFGLTTGLQTRALTDHRPLLSCAGFKLRKEGRRLRGFLVSELWESSGITP